MRERLILFDIDGTLILDDGAAREAFARALMEVYGFDRGLHDYDFSGKTDPEITHMILSDAGFDSDAIERGLPPLWEVYLQSLSRLATRERVRVLSGVHPLLERLSAGDHFTLGLLTGNIERGARIKLSSHDLNRFFPFGAFGSDSMHRPELPPIAIMRASDHHGRPFELRDAVIIGDSIYDIRCGVPHEVRTIAVASGRTPRTALEAENPDFIFDSLDDVEAVIKAIEE